MIEARKFRPLIWVEGLIGCGKSTFSKEVGSRLNLRIVEEPVEGNPYLGKFYKDSKKYGFGMQMFLLHQRFAMQQLASYEATGIGNYQGAILDRSLAGDRVFAKMLMESEDIEALDWETYEMAYNLMARSLLPPTLLIFLDVQPETAYERMKKRNRTEENGVPLEYLKKLRNGYNELLREAETALLPWAHAVRVSRLVWEPDTLTPKQWDRVAQTVKDMCRIS
jgi:deoxyadenosine/deoxycytidine kinase